MTSSPDPTQRVKAAKSGPDDSCVEMPRSNDTVEVRNTKARGTGPSPQLTPAGFEDGLGGAKSGELAHLLQISSKTLKWWTSVVTTGAFAVFASSSY